jgi:molybdate transport system substrate-binding protein
MIRRSIKRGDLPMTMFRWPRAVRLAATVAISLTSLSAASAADLHVMISGGFAAAYTELVPQYERASGNHVITARGPSMGETPEAIPNRLERGEPADVLIMVDDALEGLMAKGVAVPGSRVDLAKSSIAMAVKFGAPKPDIGSVDAFRKALINAKSIAYSDSASGVYLEKVLFPKIDIEGKIQSHSRMIPAEPVGQVVARGEAELGFQQKSELQPVKGIEIVGLIPAELQKVTVFVAGVGAKSTQPNAARDFIKFLTSRDAAAAIYKSGMDPVSASVTKSLPSGELVKPPQGAEITKPPVSPATGQPTR